ncbi:MAG: hypothetical protein ACTSO4_17155, partial [Promethearchaeota archaeon]
MIKKYLKKMFGITCIVGSIIILIWLIIQQINLPEMAQFFSNVTTIFSSVFCLSLRYIYDWSFNQPDLTLELEEFRNELIRIYRTHSFSQAPQDKKQKRFNVVTTSTSEICEKSKYIRIKLVNRGKKTAENCRIKIHIFDSGLKKVHEESYLYPSGYHQSKKKRELPPAVPIAPKDSQIFDICSTNNLWENQQLVRFEDYFTYSTVQGQEEQNLIGTYYIKLFVYSDNNPAFEKQYLIYLNEDIQGLDWEKLDIKEF